MANVIVPPDKVKVDPHHPEKTDPTYAKSVAVGQRRLREGKLKFADRGEEESYWKAVRSNPANVPGLPPFAPPLELPKIAGFGDGFMAEDLPCGHKWKSKVYDEQGGIKRWICSLGHEFDSQFTALT
jgi:hypothetical protein